MVPPELNGWKITGVSAAHTVAGAGTTSTQIQIIIATSTNGTGYTFAESLSRPIHIDPSDISSDFAQSTTTAVINTSANTITQGALIYAELKNLITTPPKGTVVRLTVTPP
jgi:hypothetical protein